MRIAFIGQKRIPDKSKNIEEIAMHLTDMGHEVFAYVQNNRKEKINEYQGIKLIYIPVIFTKNINAVFYSLLSTLHAIFCQYDVIHYQGIGSCALSFIPKLLQKKTAIISTFDCRNYVDKKYGWFAKKYLKFGEKMACIATHATIVPRKTLKSYVFSKYKTKAIFIPNGASAKLSPKTDVLERWNLKDKKYILSFGNYLEDRGLEYLIESFESLERTNKLSNGFKLMIIENDSKFKNVTSEKNNIIFTKNHAGSTLQQLFSHAYLFIQPSKSKESSAHLLEAMSYGVAPLVSNFQENLDIIGKCGFSFHSRSEEDLEEKLAYLLNKPEEVEKIGKMAKERIKKEYGWDTISRKILRVYELNQKSQSKLLFRKINAENKSYV